MKQVNNTMNFLVRQWRTVMAAAMIAMFALIMLMGVGQSIWFDEGYSILLAKHSYAEIFALTNVDAHPPLYYLLLKAWGDAFGWSEFALRSLSALLMALATGVGLLLVKRLFSTKIALAVMPFLLVAPFLLRYGYEVRMYALACLIGVVASYVFVIALKTKQQPGRRLWIIYGVLVALGMYTLYMTLVIWLSHVVWLLVTTKPRKQLLRHPAFLGLGTAIILFLPQLPVFINQTIHSALPGIGTELTLTKLVSVLGVLTIYTPEWQIGGWYSLLLIAGIILFCVLFRGALKNKDQKQGLFFLSVLVVVPLVFYALTSLPPRTPIFIERYMAHVALYLYMVIALVVVIGLMGKRKLLASAFGVVAVVILLTGATRLYSTGNLNLERMQLPETRQIKASIPCSSDTTVVADDPYTYIDSVYYFDDCNLVFFSQKPLEFKGGYAPLHNSNKRISSAEEVTTKKIVHLHWNGAESSFAPSSHYRITETISYDKQLATVYEQ